MKSATEAGGLDEREAPSRGGAAPTAATGGLAGSALSPATWAKALDAVREMTVRR